MSETPIFPPVRGLSPHANPQILSPPVKKDSPGPVERRVGENGSGQHGGHNGFGGY